MNLIKIYDELGEKGILGEKRLGIINKHREEAGLSPYLNVDSIRHAVMRSKKKLKNIQSLPEIDRELQKDLLDIVEETIDEDIKNIGIKKEQVETKTKYKELLLRFNDIQDKLETIVGVKEADVKEHKIESNHKESEATAVWVASDWHCDEIVDPNTINQANKFNSEIAEQRVKKFFKNGLRLTNILSKDIKIDNILLAVLGDMISGYIHPELVENNSESPTQALIRFRSLLISGINYILENSNYKLTLVCKMGNHGRTTEKMRVSTGYKNSYERLIYHLIANDYKGNERVEFIVEDGYHTYYKIYGYTLRFHHGDAVNYGGGVGGITIPLNKAISQWNKFQKADIDVLGHFHQLTFHNNFVVNGSLVGYNAYANRIKADYEKPQQGFFLIEKDHGKIMQTPIFLDI